MCVDLHTHSIYSDGTATPEELVAQAAQLKLQALAITDHDTMEGYDEAHAAGNRAGVRIISGLEISCLHGPLSMHMLGYGVDPENTVLNHKLQQLQNGRQKRNRRILEKLADLGMKISYDELQENSQCGQTGRPHIARLLVAKRIVSGMDQAFRRYLGKGKPAYAERFCFKAAEAIDFIHGAGGVAVLAHPGILSPDMSLQARLVAELVEQKLDGLEIFHPAHSKKIQKKLHELARRYNLITTGGSDYHGGNHGNSGLAGGNRDLCPPDSILETLLERIETIRAHRPAGDKCSNSAQ